METATLEKVEHKDYLAFAMVSKETGKTAIGIVSLFPLGLEKILDTVKTVEKLGLEELPVNATVTIVNTEGYLTTFSQIQRTGRHILLSSIPKGRHPYEHGKIIVGEFGDLSLVTDSFISIH